MGILNSDIDATINVSLTDGTEVSITPEDTHKKAFLLIVRDDQENTSQLIMECSLLHLFDAVEEINQAIRTYLSDTLTVEEARIAYARYMVVTLQEAQKMHEFAEGLGGDIECLQ